MTKTEFQAEAAVAEAPRRYAAATVPERTTVSTDSLMLGLQLRPWLTDDEHEYLDSLAPIPTLAFLVQDGRYLHPCDVPLFDSEQLGGRLGQTADAIFTQRYEHTNGDRKGIYHIHWANVAPSGHRPLIFGLFGPTDQMASPNAINRFYRLVADLRRAYADGARVVEQVSSSLDDSDAGMLVDRDTGTILVCNEHMADLCRCSSQQLVGRRIQDIHLESDSSGHSPIKMEHIDQSHFHLCLIRTGRTLAVEDVDDPLMAAQFMHAMRNKLTGIIGGTSELTLDLPEQHRPLLDSIVSESQQLAAFIDRFDLLLTYRNRTNQTIDVIQELILVIDRQPQEILVHHNDNGARTATVRAPSGSWRQLFSTVFDQHRAGRRPKRFLVETMRHGTSLAIAIRSDSDQRSIAKPFFGQFIQRLSELLGADVTTFCDDRSGHMTTEIKCPVMN